MPRFSQARDAADQARRPDAIAPGPGRAKPTPADRFKTVMQILAIAGLAAYFALLFHKGAVDIGALARQHGSGDFWAALGRHLLRNLGGG